LPFTTAQGCTLPMITSENYITNMIIAAEDVAKRLKVVYKIKVFELTQEIDPKEFLKERGIKYAH